MMRTKKAKMMMAMVLLEVMVVLEIEEGVGGGSHLRQNVEVAILVTETLGPGSFPDSIADLGNVQTELVLSKR